MKLFNKNYVKINTKMALPLQMKGHFGIKRYVILVEKLHVIQWAYTAVS